MYKNTTEKNIHRATRSPPKTGGELRCSVRVVSSLKLPIDVRPEKEPRSI